MSEKKRVLVTGATGFVGRAVVAQLLQNGHEVWAVSRRGDCVGAAEGIPLDVTRAQSVTAAIESVQPEVVVHLVGIIDEREQSFEMVHIEGTRHLLKVLPRGVRFLHMSALGADLDSESAYSRTKAHAERLVREASLHGGHGATIFRPSLIFGEGDDFFGRVLKDLVTLPPVVPQIGDGHFPFSPISVEDVALAFSRALSRPNTADRTYELVGKDTFTFRELLLLEMRVLGLNKPLIPVPLALMDRMVPLMGLFSKPPITTDQYAMLKAGNTADHEPAARALDLPLIRLWPRLAELLDKQTTTETTTETVKH